MTKSLHTPILELKRGAICESLHFGSIAVVDSHNKLWAQHGDPNIVTFLRSSSKPFQALPLIENGGPEFWHLSKKEIAITCASHTGTDDHVATIEAVHHKIGVEEPHLLCGSHPPIDPDAAYILRQRNQKPTQTHHNCSGKHSGMLALARLLDHPIHDYINPNHPIQIQILQSFSEMCGIDQEEIIIGTDGCSAPNFAIPLRNAALGFARLCDPAPYLKSERANACQTLTDAMTTHPDMVSGPGRFDTRLMQVAQGKIISKGGAEGYQCLGILPKAIDPDSPGIGIAIKISDGDSKNRARPAVALEILRQLGALDQSQLDQLADFGPHLDIKNWRDIIVGQARPLINLNGKSVISQNSHD
jgi:L-asparaginase II